MISPSTIRRLLLVWLVALAGGCGSHVTEPVCAGVDPPFTVSPGLFDQARPVDLGLDRIAGAETISIFQPGPGDNAYNHGVVLMPFKGRLYAQWQTSWRDEDADDTHVVFSSSDDGTVWTEPTVLAPTRQTGMRTSGGWWTDGETLIAFVNVWPETGSGLREGMTEYLSSRDGRRWSAPAVVTTADGGRLPGVIEQDPHALPDGRVVGAAHVAPGLIASPWFTDDPLAVSGWRRGALENLPYAKPGTSRELEPSLFLRADGALVMIFRDQGSSYRKLASVSCDRGETWSRPVLTTMPDARTKQSAGNLPDGSAYLVGNPVNGADRRPLVIALSRDGREFDRAFVLRDGESDLQPMRYPGRFKRAGYSYVKSVAWRDHLYVAYATNKEDVELTRVPIVQLTTSSPE